MNLSRLFNIVLYIIAFISIRNLIKQPGNAMALMSIGAYMVAVLFSFLGYMGSSQQRYSRQVWKFAGAPFLLFALAFAYWGQQEMAGQDVVAKWISPYPSITDIVHIPDLHHEYVWSWIMESNDSPEKVYDFYEDETHYLGWKKEVKGPFMTFTKPGYALQISASDKAGSGSAIFYSLKQQAGNEMPVRKNGFISFSPRSSSLL